MHPLPQELLIFLADANAETVFLRHPHSSVLDPEPFDRVVFDKMRAGQVGMIHRRREFRAQTILVEELQELARQKSIDIRLPESDPMQQKVPEKLFEYNSPDENSPESGST